MASAPPFSLAPGSIVAQRFTLQHLAGYGGMSVVFLARDEHTGLPVALKLLQSSGDSDVARRFAREARILTSLSHPGIVSYVAHGLSEGQPFLAMEWLEGEDLARRLARKPLSPAETLQMMLRVADALAAAHSQGIIHRDLKPSNLFLRSGQPHDVVLLDFGVARIGAATQALTGSATVLGTPGYMAPEQASSLEDISPAADIFSLGCVLYECLTGLCPFRAPHVAAVLAKILFFEPTPLRTMRPELPTALQQLVERMLDKQPAQRPADAQHLLRALRALELPFELPAPVRATPDSAEAEENPAFAVLPEPALAEQHLVSVLLATPSTSLGETPTLGSQEAERNRQHLQPLLQSLQAQGAHAALLADGSLLATFALERGTATDQAALAAHCALSIKERWADSFVALTTGLGLRGHPLPMGEAVDRAGELLRRPRQLTSTSLVLVDETTASLLHARFQVEKTPSDIFLLGGAPLDVDESRPLLGRPTPCVGREQELALLELAYTSCVEDSCVRALLITALAGTGKSRLRHELLRHLERHASPPLVLLGRADPMNTRAAHGLLGQAVRRLCEVVDGEPLEARRAKLAQRLTRHLPAEQHQEVTEFLGELCATPFPGEDSPRLRAAREDPQLMNGQVTRALVSWLKVECAHHPVVLMLEDLHWSDGPSIHLMEQVLHELADHPLMVLALARPEVKELFPRLWGQSLQEVPLRGLSQKASTQLVREVLGPQVPEAVVSRLVGLAAGNALFLEELIRSEAEGHGEETPGSVLAMLQSRLQRLEPVPRRVVLAASVFGRTFWTGAVRALLEPALSSEELDHGLRRLVELELVQPQPGSRFPAETEYRFHHALVRDAAYSLVPESLRATGHLQGGRWLEAAGESEPIVLAEHYQLGRQKQKALHFFTRACKQSCERQRSDMQGAQRCLEAALACGPTGQALTELQVLEADIAFWTDDFPRTLAVSNEVLPKLAEGSSSWMQVVGNLILMNAMAGRIQEAGALGQRLLSMEPAPEATAPYTEALAFLIGMYLWSGHPELARPLLERQSQVALRGGTRDDFAYGWWCLGQGHLEYEFGPRLWRTRSLAEASVEAFGKAGADRNQLLSRALLVMVLEALGELPRALEVLSAGLTKARYYARAGNWLQVHAALVLSGSHEPAHQEEARRLALLEREAERTNPQHLGIAAIALARVALARGSFGDAERWAREACALLKALPVYQVYARTSLSTALRCQGRVHEGRAEAEQAMHLLERMGGEGSTAVGVWLTLAEACEAQADNAAAEGALRKALECLRLRGEALPDAAARERFLSQVPGNARVLHLARERSLTPGSPGA
jgi:serine/threonine protein kinase